MFSGVKARFSALRRILLSGISRFWNCFRDWLREHLHHVEQYYCATNFRQVGPNTTRRIARKTLFVALRAVGTNPSICPHGVSYSLHFLVVERSCGISALPAM